MTSSARRRTMWIVALAAVAVGGFLLFRAAGSATSPEAERVQKALLAQGYMTFSAEALPTEPGRSARLDVRGNSVGSPLESCLVTVGSSLDEVQVTECTPAS